MKKWILCVVMVLALVLLCACGAGKKCDLSTLREAMLSAMNPDDVMELDKSDIESLYDIQSEDMRQYVALMAKTSINSDEIILIEATDDAAAERIEERLNARYQAKLEEARAFLPGECEKVEACSVERSGRFISLIVSSQVEELTALYHDLIMG